MPLKVYNNLTRKLEEFEPISEKQVGMYVCGITPYDETHLGHARAYITFDVIRRYLEYSGYKVKHVQNITDIDDKIINKSKQLAVSCEQLADKYTASYFEVMDKLNVKRADEYPKATENIPGMIDWIKRLMDKGYAYKLDDGVYFEVDKFKEYGKLSHRKKEEQESGARVKVDQSKKNPLDFALWKFAKEGEPSWESPWGAGRPGWHIECSVMSTKYLGEQFDIHGGGLDLQFPHHENEIAQTEAATGKVPWVKYWIHNGFVTINKEKMSKSLGNIFSVKDLLEKYDPMAIRLLVLSTHYRSPINFSDDILNDSQQTYKNITSQIETIDFAIKNVQFGDSEIEVEIDETKDELFRFRRQFLDYLDSDFNTAGAIGILFDFNSFINKHLHSRKAGKDSLAEYKKLLLEFYGILGIVVKGKGGIGQNIQDKIDEREIARRNRDFKKSDAIRAELEAQGIILEDTPFGPKWTRK